MKIGTKKWIALLLAAAMLLTGAACKLEDTPADAPTNAPGAGQDRDAVAASVGGKYDITRGEVLEQYDSLVSMYEYYGMPAPTADADVETMQDTVVSSLVAAKILLLKAEEKGLLLDEAAKAAVEADVEEQMQGLLEEFSAQAVNEGSTDVEARAKEIFNEQLSAAGWNMDMDAYRAYIKGILEEEAVTAKLEAAVKADVTVTDEEVQSYYDNLLETQKADYSETPANYQTDAESYEMDGGNPVVYVPEGYMRVKTITVSPKEPLDAEHATLRSELDALEAEYGRLMLEDAAASAARLAEIRTEYAEKKAKAEALYEAYIKDARAKIEAAYAALEAGKSVDEVLKEYGEDDIYTTYPAIMEKGILMLKEGETVMDAKLVEAVLALEEGAHSKIIQLEDMFYIVSPAGDEKGGTVALADVRDAIKSMAQAEKAEAAWTELQETWNNDTSLVVYHEDVYRDIGKAVG